MPVTNISSGWVSGNLVFYETAVGQSVTGDVFTIGTAAVKVGGTSQDIDFQFYATGSKSFIIDAGAGTITAVGITQNTNAPIVSTCTTQALNATTSAVAGGLTGSAVCVYATGVAGTQDVGIAAYFDATAFGQSTANWTYGAGIWLNLHVDWKQNLSGGWGGHEQVTALSLGVYAPDAIGTDVNDIDVIYGVKAELVGGTAFPTTNGCYFAALNVNQTAATRTAIFFAHQQEAVGKTTAKSVAAGAVALVDINGTMHYVNVYTS